MTSAPASSDSESVLSFWFGTLDPLGQADEVHAARWWKKDPAFDQSVRDQFGQLHEALARGEHADWLATPRARLSCVLVFDQFSRNMFRGTARMFAYDESALRWATEGVARGEERVLAHDERTFLLMPFMHSEDLATQEHSVRLFSAFRDELQGARRERASYNLKFAEQHRDIVQRFGRFPHRNQILGRSSTAEELEFLRQPNSSF